MEQFFTIFVKQYKINFKKLGNDMKFQDLELYFGSLRKIADSIYVSVATLCLWKRKKQIPFAEQFRIQAITGGVLKPEDLALYNGKDLETLEFNKNVKPRQKKIKPNEEATPAC